MKDLIIIFLFGCILTRIEESFLLTLSGTVANPDFKGPSAHELRDGSIILLGGTDKDGNDDILVTKLDPSTRNITWGISIGEGSVDYGHSISCSSDSKFIIVGETSYGNSEKNVFLGQFFSSNGSVDWVVSLGGVVSKGYSVQETSDSGIIITGVSRINNYDVLLAKFSPNGSLEWHTTVGGNADDVGFSVAETADSNGYVVAGWTLSEGSGDHDVLFLKFFSNGSLEYASTFGGTNRDKGYSVSLSSDGNGYIVTGSAIETLSAVGSTFLANFSLSGNLESIRYLGNNDFYEVGNSVQILKNRQNDSSYLVAGYIWDLFSSGDKRAFVASFSSEMDGELEWISILEGDTTSYVKSIQVNTETGGILVSGYGGSYGAESDDIFLSMLNGDNGEGILWKTYNRDDSPFAFGVYDPQEFQSEYWDGVTENWNNAGLWVEYLDHSIVQKVAAGVECTVVDSMFNCFDYFGNKSCSGHGNCIDVDLCECFPGYFGKACEINVCFGEMSNDTANVCSGNGRCIDSDMCVDCKDEYFGKNCEKLHYVSFVTTTESTFSLSTVDLLDDGSFLTIGSSSSDGVFTSKYFENGTLEWTLEITFDSGLNYQSRDLLVIPGGDYFIVLGEYRTGGYNNVITLTKFELNGSHVPNHVWTARIGRLGESYFGHAVKLTSDMGFIVTGSCSSFGPAKENVLLIKYNREGGIVWATAMGGSESEYGQDVIEVIEGYVVVGMTRSEGEGNYDIFVSKFDLEGGLDWAVTFGGDGDEKGVSVVEVEEERKYVVIGSTMSFGEFNQDIGNILVLQFYYSGAFEWAVLVEGPTMFDGEYPSSMYLANSEEVVITGNSRNSASEEDIVFFSKVFPYDIESSYIFVSNGLESISIDQNVKAIKETHDNGFVIVGNFVDVSKSYLAKGYHLGGDNSVHPGCESIWTEVTTSYSFSHLLGVAYKSWSASYDVNGKSHLTHSFVDPSISFSEVDKPTTTECLVKYNCYDVINEGSVCRGHGDCVFWNTCRCDEGYFGEECQIQHCFEIFSNHTNAVCSGHGSCVNIDKCNCDAYYEYEKDCSMWKCFGRFRNETSVICSGERVSAIKLTSHGNCTSHDSCECEEGYRSSESCDWSCYGYQSWLNKSCGEFGRCVDFDSCNCTSGLFVGKYCDIPICKSIPDGVEGVCSGHGACIEPDVCDCEVNYFSTVAGLCDKFACNGIDRNKKSSVCSGHGICVSFDICTCEGSGYEGEDCDQWNCGRNKDDPSTCSGKGKCKSPNQCECKTGYDGDFCETNTLYASVMAPVLSSSGFIGIVVLIISALFCLFFCICICCFCCGLMTLILSYLLSQRLKWKKFEELDNVDILLQEQKADRSVDIAHLRINKNLFQCSFKEIKIEKILGEGGSNSVVYLASWKNQKTAFKCFRTRMICSSQDTFDEFEKEAEIFSSISHPNIVAFYGCTIDPPRVGILMEFCPKGECFEYTVQYEEENQKRYPMKERFRILFETASALDYLHSRNIAHRDLKCENVLLDQNESCKVMDFGLAKISDSLSKQKTKGIGTPYYMAPEVSSGRLDYSEKCDVFSFSIMCFILVSGSSEPYGEISNNVGVELRVARDKNFRPDVNKMKDFLKPHEYWILDVTQKSWDENPMNRPSFGEICEIYKKKKDEKNSENSHLVVLSKEQEEVVRSSKEEILGGEMNVRLRKENEDLRRMVESQKEEIILLQKKIENIMGKE